MKHPKKSKKSDDKMNISDINKRKQTKINGNEFIDWHDVLFKK
jgi:hypothetical protein